MLLAWCSVNLRLRNVEQLETNQTPKLDLNIFDLALMALLVVFSGSRVMTGTDWYMYFTLYGKLQPRSDWYTQLLSAPQEWGFTLLQLGVKVFSEEPAALFWVLATLTVVPCYLRIKAEIHDLVLSVVMFICLGFYLSSLNISRQSLSIAVLFGTAYWVASSSKAKKLLFFAGSGLAASLHLSSVLSAVLYWTLRRRSFGTWSLILFLAAGFVGAAVISNQGFILEILGSLSSRYSQYALNQQASGIGTWLGLVFRLALVALVLALAKRASARERAYSNYVLLSVGFLALGTQIVEAARLDFYFSIYIVLLLPNLIQKSPWKHGLRFAVLLATLVFGAFYVNFFHGLIPYHSTVFTG